MLKLRVFYDPEVDAWVASCIDFHMVSQAKQRKDLMAAFAHVFFGKIVVWLEHGEQPSLRKVPPDLDIEREADCIVDFRPFDYSPPWASEAFSKLMRSFVH